MVVCPFQARVVLCRIQAVITEYLRCLRLWINHLPLYIGPFVSQIHFK